MLTCLVKLSIRKICSDINSLMVQFKISIFYRSILLISLYLGIFQDVFFFTTVLRESLVISYCLGCTVLHYVISNSCNEEEFPVKMLSGARQMSFKRFRLHILLEFSQLLCIFLAWYGKYF